MPERPNVLEDQSKGERVFRVRKFYRNVGVMSLLFFPTALLLSVAGMWSEWSGLPQNDPKRMLGVVLFLVLPTVVWSAFTLFSVRLLLDYWSGRLSINGSRVVQQRLFHKSTFDLADVRELRWGTRPNGGSIVVYMSAEKIKMHLDHFEFDERLHLIEYFRAGVPLDRQRNWDAFCYRIAMPLRRVLNRVEVVTEDEVRFTRKRWDIYLLPTSFVIALVGVQLARSGNPRMLVAPAPLLLLWLILRFATPKSGLVFQRMRVTDIRNLMFLGFWGLLAYAGLFLFMFIQPPQPLASLLALTGLFVGFGGLLVRQRRIRRERQPRIDQAVEAAVRQWESAAKAESS